MKAMRRVYLLCLLWALLVGVAQHFNFNPLARQELAALDFRYRLRRAKPAPADIVILTIDQHSLNVFDEQQLASDPQLALLRQWPFPRRVYAEAIQKLCDAGARRVAVDLLFVSPKEDDAALRDAVARYRERVVLGANYSDDGTQLMMPSVVVPEEIPTKSVAGYVNYWADADGAVRRSRHRVTMPATGAEEWPSFPARAAGRGGPDGLINFIGPGGSFETHPFYELFYGKTWERNLKSGAVFRDKIVLIGPAANFQHDQHPTPFGVMDGVEIHANAVATLLRGDALRELPAGVGWVSLLLLALATAALLNAAAHPVGKLALLAGVCAAYAGISQAAFASAGMVLWVAAPVWTVAGGGVAGLAAQLVAEQLERLRVRRTLDRYVSRPVAEEILKNTEGYEQSLGGERRAVTILFSDIRGFTSMSEQANPVELVRQLNEYLTAMVDVVLKHDGTLDKFIGDAIMGVYGAPTSAGAVEDAWRAVQTAHEMRMRLAELRLPWRIGIGLNHGEVVVGNIGSPHRMEYTVIGDPVNVASRVEGLNKDFGTDILLTEAVLELVRERVEVELAGETTVKGRGQPVKVYALKSLRI